ncbi:MAG: AEC family transporter [Candidatus Lokiarchaeota archaeon]|nr:AEC family transporter [Candidatus Lokiarchaeota archaeon]MBD3199654.1 AEC family transporter [Candidatus Lokiarchaeota archaeon]
MADANYVFLLSLSIIVIGFIIKKIGLITEDDGKIIAKLVLNVTLPALILEVFSSIVIYPNLVILPFLSIFYSLIIIAFVFLLYRKYPLKLKGLLMMTSIGFNIGLFAYPMIRGIWGAEGMEYLIMFDLGNSFVIFLFAYSIGYIHSPNLKPEKEKINLKAILKRLAKSVPLIVLFIALFINISGLSLPLFINDLLNILSRANMALTLLVLGIFINIQFEKQYWKEIAKVLITRYGFGLTFGVILYLLLPFGKVYNVVIMVALILPIGLTAIPFSVEFGYNEKITSTLVNLTNLISFGFMWLIVLLFGIG